MRIVKGGTFEVGVTNLGKEAHIQLSLTGEPTMEIRLTENQTDTLSIPVSEIEGIDELSQNNEKLKLKEITLNFGVKEKLDRIEKKIDHGHKSQNRKWYIAIGIGFVVAVVVALLF